MSTVHFVDLSAPGCLLSRPVCTLWARDGVTVRLSSTIHFRGQPLSLYNVPWVAHAEFRGQILRLCVPWVAHAEFRGQPLRLYIPWVAHAEFRGQPLRLYVPWVAHAEFSGQPLRLYYIYISLGLRSLGSHMQNSGLSL